MKERPVIFNGEMVRAIVDGRKTQTRRIAKADNSNHLLGCPFGQIGDRLWVRETFAILGNEDGCPIDWDGNLIKGDEKHAARIYKASCWQEPGNYGLWSIPNRDTQYEGAWRPSIHMPRWASRISLEITAVRVERLNDISHEDAKAEGCCYGRGGGIPDFAVTPADHFPTLWASIYGEESWNANPWVWVIEFRRLEVRDASK